MRSDRNNILELAATSASLVDWDMRSDRNTLKLDYYRLLSLVDWDMRSDRNSPLKMQPRCKGFIAA